MRMHIFFIGPFAKKKKKKKLTRHFRGREGVPDMDLFHFLRIR
jgi:hypothetical protein